MAALSETQRMFQVSSRLQDPNHHYSADRRERESGIYRMAASDHCGLNPGRTGRATASMIRVSRAQFLRDESACRRRRRRRADAKQVGCVWMCERLDMFVCKL